MPAKYKYTLNGLYLPRSPANYKIISDKVPQTILETVINQPKVATTSFRWDLNNVLLGSAPGVAVAVDYNQGYKRYTTSI